MKGARYAELRPEQLAERVQAAPVAFVPWGALEWHSVHLPVGLDGIVVEHIAERAVERTGGVVLPAMYLPITTLPHRFSISFRAGTMHAGSTTCLPSWRDRSGSLRAQRPSTRRAMSWC